jgi:IS1 family transposase
MFTWQAAQSLLNRSLPARHYRSDGAPVYQNLMYLSGEHEARYGWDKSETYSVEGDNAELRHYLARLARRSRCFSRSSARLKEHLRIFVHAWNARQLRKRKNPRYPAHLIECLPTLL